MDWDGVTNFLRGALAVTLAILLLATSIFTFSMFCHEFTTYFEHKAWNRLHKTEYTWFEFFSGKLYIEQYHYPNRQETNKIELNLNNK